MNSFSKALIATVAVVFATAASAQDATGGAGWRSWMMGGNHMTGQGVMGPGMMGQYGSGNMMGYGMGRGNGGCMMYGTDAGDGTYIDGRLAFLKAELKITEAQSSAWNTYADALRANSDSMLSMHQQMMGQFQSDDRSATSFLDFQIAAMRSRLDALEKLKPAMTALYDALSKDQKEKADSVLPMMGCI
ncbi:MAG: Spy/CpxP family protein refolding chaperone [Parvibaculum sp.]